MSIGECEYSERDGPSKHEGGCTTKDRASMIASSPYSIGSAPVSSARGDECARDGVLSTAQTLLELRGEAASVVEQSRY